MKLKYVESGSPDCPLVRLSAFHTEEIVALQRFLLELSQGETNSPAVLNELQGVESADGLRLRLHLGARDLGVQAGDGDMHFEWHLSSEGWIDVTELLEPFTKRTATGRFQWLDDRGTVSVLISTDGSW